MPLRKLKYGKNWEGGTLMSKEVGEASLNTGKEEQGP